MGAPAVRQDGHFLDWGGERYDFRHKLGKGQNAATVDQTLPLLDFLNAVPAYSRCVFRGIDVLLLDSVDLSLIGKKNLIIDLGTTLVRKNPAGTGGLLNEGHLFKDRKGISEGLVFLGGRFDLQRANWIIPGSDPDPGVGDLVSGWFFQRCKDIQFIGCHVFDGVEEGGKFYKCQDVVWRGGSIVRTRNNGLQFHAPLEASEGFQGDTGAVPNQATKNILVEEGYFGDIDDGTGGLFDGQGVTFNHLDDSVPTENITVRRNRLARCARGVWFENNGLIPGRNVEIVENRIREMISFGIGVVGVDGASVHGNHLYDIGQASSQSSERTAIVISGSASLKSSYVDVRGNVIKDRRGAGAEMHYGYDIKQVEHSTFDLGKPFGATLAQVRIDATAEAGCQYRKNPADEVKLHIANPVALADGVEHTVQWDVEDKDTNDLHDHRADGAGGSQALREVAFKVKTPGTHVFEFTGGVPFGATSGRVRLILRRGATSTVEQQRTRAAAQTAGEETIFDIPAVTMQDLQIGDEILARITIFGASLSLSSAKYQTKFIGRHVGG